MSLIDLAYLGALGFASPYLLYKAIRSPRHVAGLRARMGHRTETRTGAGPCVWVHGVSVGEVVAAEPLVSAIERALPGHEVALTTSTQTGQDVARRKFPGRKLGYFPLDFSWAVRRAFDALRPSLVVLVELELWPNFLAEARRRGVPVVVVNGRISEKSFKGYGLARRFLPLDDVAHYCVQTDQYARRFLDLGIPADKITVTGSMKYDIVQTRPASGPADLEARSSLGLDASETVWIAGSTHRPEERELLSVFARLAGSFPALRLVLAPRHDERAAEVEREVVAAGLRPVLRSAQLASSRARGGPVERAPAGSVIIVDTLGELSRLYAGADLVFVGGSLIPHGGQNVLEPAALGKPVLFGPHVQNFQESVDRLLAAEGAVQVASADDLLGRLRVLLEDPARARALGARGLATIEAAKGATERTIAAIAPFAARGAAHQATSPPAGGARQGIHVGGVTVS